MALVRLTATLNPGGEGVRLDKLSKFAGELEEFLRSLLGDLGVPATLGDWVSKDFANGSLEFANEFARPVEDATLVSFNKGVRYFLEFDEKSSVLTNTYSEKTVRKFIDLGNTVDSDEHVPIGLYDEGNLKANWVALRRRPALELERAAIQPIKYVGDVHGSLSTWYKESQYFNIRDAISGSLVKCVYPVRLYNKIHKLYEDKDAFVYVYGLISATAVEKRPREISVDDVEVFERLSNEEFGRLSGLVPDLTGDELTDEYIDRIRRDADS